MRWSILLVRWLVGILFIFSGLVKANDPLGLSYKMQEFFEVWGWPSFEQYTLLVAEAMNVFEIVLGVAVIIGWQMQRMAQSMLLLIVFFTYLTGYALFSGKIKTCGCFGDCLPLTAAQSFTKDLILLALSVLLLWQAKKTKPLCKTQISIPLLLIAFAATVYFQWYVGQHLPVVDCLPYKKGNNLLVQMQPPPNAVPDSTVITYQYKKNEKVVEFDNNHFPDDFDSTYLFINRYDKVVRKGTGGAKIVDFALQTLNNNDTTQAVLHSKCVLIAVKSMSENNQWIPAVQQLLQTCQSKQLPVFVVTADAKGAAALLSNTSVTILKCDATVLKTMARVNPTCYLLNNAEVMEKKSYVDVADFESAILNR